MPDQLAQAHRRAQLALRARALRDLLRLWPMYDLARMRSTWPAFEEAAVLLVQARGRTSAGLAAAFYRAHRFAAGVPGSPPTMRATPSADQIATGLRVVGLFEAGRALVLRRQAEVVARNTLVKLSGAVGMYVLDHGRDVLANAVRDDPKALGWARETSGRPCAFCAMLAARGPVYRSEDTASFEAHRGCACFPRPQWDRDQQWPEGSRRLASLWNAAPGDGTDQLNAFRRTLEGR